MGSVIFIMQIHAPNVVCVCWVSPHTRHVRGRPIMANGINDPPLVNCCIKKKCMQQHIIHTLHNWLMLCVVYYTGALCGLALFLCHGVGRFSLSENLHNRKYKNKVPFYVWGQPDIISTQGCLLVIQFVAQFLVNNWKTKSKMWLKDKKQNVISML